MRLALVIKSLDGLTQTEVRRSISVKVESQRLGRSRVRPTTLTFAFSTEAG